MKGEFLNNANVADRTEVYRISIDRELARGPFFHGRNAQVFCAMVPNRSLA
jgi:hypothetical protein